MEGYSHRSRAITFAVCAGAVAFILALVAASSGRPDVDTAARALIVAIVCGAMCWAAAERALAAYATAIDSAIARLARATEGDLQSPVPADVVRCMPPFADAMRGLFAQLDTNLATVRRLAMYDAVTALPNRTHFRRSCDRMLMSGDAADGGVLFFIDLDRFKTVNDTLGHATGDALLAWWPTGFARSPTTMRNLVTHR